MQYDFKGFYQENRSYVICTVIVMVLCVACAWLYCDYHRNDTDYHNTDNTVGDIDKRLQSVEGRLAGMSERIEQTEKAVTGISRRISTSTGYAIEIADGVGVAEKRLESAIQRSDRIEDLIRKIERANR